MATFYSRAGRKTTLCFLLAGLFLPLVLNAAPDAGQKVFADRCEKEFLRAQASFLADTNNSTNTWQFARACFDASTFATNNNQKAQLARLGIAAAKPALEREPKSAPLHYYLAMNYGQLADAEAPSMTSYRLVREIEREFKLADGLDEKFDFAGTSRNLGELYLQAPGWPISIGNNRRAKEFLERAVRLAPEDPENLLNLAEAGLKWRDRIAAQKTLQQLEILWPAAQTNFTGEAWEQSWDDWRTRREKARDEFKKVFKSAP